eukprot:GILJ01001136.1.p1 GENE.GILJ01001136.1~~GILJ01001136.1.p1  ORF type:complete len:472 (-),score=66.36 GILJ01001136.1:224-1639(-)
MDPLPDPLGDRAVKDVPPPPHFPLSHELLFPKKDGIPDWRLLQKHLTREGRLLKEDVIGVINAAMDIFSRESNMLALHDPITVVGDIHGQFFDLVKLLEVGGSPDKTQYLFLGDYVDRGSFSCEVTLLLYAIKINYPQSFFMVRGNHECRQMTSFFNFRDECDYKYDRQIYNLFMDSFDTLPIAATINGKFLALHGGLSPEMRTLTDIQTLSRFSEPPRAGMFCDMLWADPVEDDGHGAPEDTVFVPNDVRGCSFFYGYNAVCDFLDNNGLLSVIRAHEAQLEGYKMHRSNEKTDFPTVITIFSAPNYCDVYNNKGAVLKFENNTLNIQQFNYSPHPYHLPNFMDVFTWSLPFVSEKVTEMLFNIIKPREGDDEGDSDEEAGKSGEALEEAQGSKYTQILKNKVKFVSRIMKMYRVLREENELIVQLKGLTPGHRIPKGLLLQGHNALKDAVKAFEEAKKWDRVNEKRPDL